MRMSPGKETPLLSKTIFLHQADSSAASAAIACVEGVPLQDEGAREGGLTLLALRRRAEHDDPEARRVHESLQRHHRRG